MDPGPHGGGAGRATLVFAAVLALFFLPALIGRDQFLFRDSGRMHYPAKQWIASELARGRLPEWNPYSGMGMPVVAGAVDAPQHPFNLLLVGLPFDAGFKLWVLLSYLAAALGAFAWARRLGRDFVPALAAGLGFALSGYLVSSSDNLQYLTAMASLPWIFAAAHGYLERGGPGRLAVLGLASAFAASAGDPQSWGTAVVGLPLYALVFRDPVRLSMRRALARGVAAAGAAVVAAAPFILPVAAWLPESSRGESFDWIEYERFHLLPVRLLELVVPHLLRMRELTLHSDLYEAYAGNPWTPIPWVLSEYLGISFVAFALIAAWRSRPARWCLLAACVFLWCATGPYAGFGQLARHLPVLSGFRYWEKVAIWPALLVPIAAAEGLERLLAAPRAARRLALAAACAAGLLLAGHGAIRLFPEAAARLLTPSERLADAGEARSLQQEMARVVPVDRPAMARVFSRNLAEGLLESGLVCLALAGFGLALSMARLARLAPVTALAILAADLAAANVRAYVLMPAEIEHPPSPIAEHLRSLPGLQRMATPFALEEPHWRGFRPAEAAWLWGNRAIYSGWNVGHRIGNAEIYSAMYPVRAARYRRRAGLVKQLPGVGIWGFAWTVVPTRLENASTMNLFPPYDVAAFDSLLPGFLVRVPHRPRAYLARELASVDRRAAMEFVLDDRSVSTDRTVLEAELPPGYLPSRGEARVTVDEPTRLEVATRSDGPALLVVNDANVAGWTARVDGRPTAILVANYLARGVWVDAGTHVVRFDYRTPGLRQGWLLFLAGALGLVAWGLRRRSRPGATAETT